MNRINAMFNRYGAIGLLDETVLNILPSLAVRIGLNEAIVLQQLNYWLQTSKHIHENKRWVYNTYEDWQKQFPFWSVRTVRRTFDNLEKKEFIISGNFNKLKIDRTKWYTINEHKLITLMNPVTATYGQIGHMEVDKLDSSSGQIGHNRVDKLDTPITRDYTEITTDINIESVSPPLTPSLNEKNSKRKIERLAYAHNVFLTKSNYEKLCKQFGKDVTDKKIQSLSKYQETKKKYKDDQHYKVLNNWLKRDGVPIDTKSRQQREDEELERLLKEREYARTRASS